MYYGWVPRTGYDKSIPKNYGWLISIMFYVRLGLGWARLCTHHMINIVHHRISLTSLAGGHVMKSVSHLATAKTIRRMVFPAICSCLTRFLTCPCTA